MTGALCLICGHDFAVWFGARTDTGECVLDGGRTPCRDALDRAHGEATRRKICPDAFDSDGKIIPGQLVHVMRAMEAAGLNPFTGRPRGPRKKAPVDA